MLAIFGKRKSIEMLTQLCQTNRNGTSTKNMIKAINELGFSVLTVQHGTLRHIMSSLQHTAASPRATMVTYLYDTDQKDKLDADSGHWAVVSSYSASQSKIILFDSYSGKKKSYPWQDFQERWKDFDLKRQYTDKRRHNFVYKKRWLERLMLVIAKDPKDLPSFKTRSAKIYTPKTAMHE